MATVQEPVRPRSQQDAFVEEQIAQASGRIRANDIGAALLGILFATLAFAVVMVFVDRWLQLSDLARQLALGSFVLSAIAYACYALSKPFRQAVNPYYAARMVERTLPNAKNSVINYLDLRDQPLPSAIQVAVGQRAAKDLKEADFEEAIHDNRLPWLGWSIGALLVAIAAQVAILRPAQYASILGRTFQPFHSAAIARQTELELVKPAGGDLVVTVNRSIDFEVNVSGRVPSANGEDAVRLRLRYNPADPSAEVKPLIQDPTNPRRWTLRLPANQVQNGFVYRVLGGDGETPEHTVTVRSTPLIESFDVEYQFRPYLNYRNQTSNNPNLEGLRGTKVVLKVRTNRMLGKGRVVFEVPEGKPPIAEVEAEKVEGEPSLLKFDFTLEQDANYRIHFQSADGEANTDPIPYTIKVLGDFPPQVDVTRPAANPVPVNGSLEVAGKASDDFGVTALRLMVQHYKTPVDEKPAKLQPIPYRPGKSFRQADGTFPRTLEYRDVAPLDKLRSEFNLPIDLQPGAILEYWLEADDNCDYPDPKKPNVGRSKVYRAVVGDPQTDEQKKDRDEAAQKDKAEHNRQQDADLKQKDGEPMPEGQPPMANPEGKRDPKPEDKKPDEKQGNAENRPNEKPQGEPPMPGERNPDDGRKPEPKNKPNEKGNSEGKNQPQGGGGKGNEKEPNGKPGEPGDSKPDSKANPQDSQPNSKPGQKQNPSANPKDEQLNAKADQIRKELDKARQENGDQRNPDNQPQGQPQNQPQGESKPEPKGEAKPDSGKQPAPGSKGESKPQDGSQPNAGPQGESKPDRQTGMNDGQLDKGDAKPDRKPEPGENKSSDNKQGGNDKPQPGQQQGGNDKPQPGQQQGGSDKPQPGQQQGGNDKPQPGQQQGGNDKPQPGQQGESKPMPSPKSEGGSKPENGKPDQQNPMNNGGESQPKAGQPKAEGQPKGNGEPKAGGQPKADGQPKGNGEPKAGGQPKAEGQPKADGQPKGNGEPKAEGQPKADGQPKGNGAPKAGDQPKADNGQGSPMGKNAEGKNGEKPGTGESQPKQGEPKGQSKPEGGSPDKQGSSQSQPKAGEGGKSQKPDQPASGNNPMGDRGQGQPEKEGPMNPGEMKPREGAGEGEPKGEAKPDPAEKGQGGGKEQGQPGKKPGEGNPGGNKEPGAKPSAEELKDASRKLADMAENLGKMLKDQPQKQPSAEEMKDAANKMRDLAKQLDEMKKTDPKAAEEIQKNLAEARKNLEKGGGDALKKAAEQASKAADEARKAADDAKGQNPEGAGKPGDQPNGKPEGSPKPGDNPMGQPGQKPDGTPMAGQGTGQPKPGDNPMGQPGQKPDGTPMPGNQSGAEAGNPSKAPDGNNPRNGGTQGGPTGGGVGEGDSGMGDGPDSRNARKAGEMQLEDFKKRVDRKMLDRLNMTEQEFQDFLSAYESMLKRKASADAAAPKDDKARGSGQGASAANTGARKVQSGTDSKGKLERGGTALPPPEFRDGYKGFTEDVSKTPKPAEKK